MFKQLFILLILFTYTLSISFASQTPEKCQIYGYKDNLFWDEQSKQFWSQKGSSSVPLHTCDIDSCTRVTFKNGTVYEKGCLARPDNTNHCTIPCFENKNYPGDQR